MNDAGLIDSLERLGLIAGPVALQPLTGGVSSDISLVEGAHGRFCVKRALPKLKVAADWRAPVGRNHAEAEWLRVVAGIAPQCVPRLIAEDEAAGWFAMEFMPHPLWKNRLRDGAIDPDFAAQVGREVARIHAATADSAELAQRFANDAVFYPIRLEAYLVAAGERHPDLAPVLEGLVRTTLATKLALVHGDISPKNILVGPAGPVFLDAECAVYGDPAFDLAFCLNHMLLKCAWRPQWRDRYLECFTALHAAYLTGVRWESAATIEARSARLLPGLFLARVDGKSPVEYITDEDWRERVRRVARQLLAAPVDRLEPIASLWRKELA